MAASWIDVQSHDGKNFKGYLSLPPTGSGPGLLLIQEIFGVNEHIKAVADQYALDGYVVLAPDLFWREKPGVNLSYSDADLAIGFKHMQNIDFPLAIQDLASTVSTLRARPECSGKVASIGYCMGGLLSFLSAANAGVDASVCYYPGGIDGQLAQAGKISCPVLFNFAEADQYIPAAAIEKVKSTFANASNVQIEAYPDVHHGFNCWARDSYNQPAATLAHGKTLEFLATKM
ncbi:MAG: dienelactone hydrolase family protein [Pseudomonadota bacterium]